MSGTNISVGSRRGVSDRVLIIGFCVLAVAIVLMAAAALANRAAWRQRTESKVAELKEAGYAVSLEERVRLLRARLPEPNAADLYRQAFPLVKGLEAAGDSEWLPVVGRAEKPAEGEPLQQEMVEALEEFLEQNREALNLFLAGAALAECSFVARLGPDGHPEWNHLGGMREGVRLLWLKALLALDQGYPDEAAAARAAMFRMSRHVGEDSYLIGFLTRVAMAGIAVDQLGALLASNASDEALHRLQKEVAALDDEFLLAAAMAGEIAFGISSFDRMKDWAGFDSSELESWLFTAYSALGQTERDRFNYLAMMESQMEVARSPLQERAQLASTSAASLGTGDEFPWRGFVNGRWLTDQHSIGFDRMVEIELRALGSIRAANAAIGAARFRATHGSYPEKLEDLSPRFAKAESLILPGTDGLLYYELEEDSYTVRDRFTTITVLRRPDF